MIYLYIPSVVVAASVVDVDVVVVVAEILS